MNQLQIPIGQLPVNLVLLSNGTVVFIRVADIGSIFDQAPTEGVSAAFHKDNFVINEQDYFYNTIYHYKDIPDMLKWLQQQNLQEPVVVFA